MNTRTAELYLSCYRPGRRDEPRVVRSAVCRAESDPVLQRRLSDQMDFDDQMAGVIESIKPPNDLRQKLSELSGRAEAGSSMLRRQIGHPAILSALFGVLLIVGFLVYLELDERSSFPGKPAVQKMLASTGQLSGVEFERVNVPTGQLGDWFYMHGYESFAVAPETSQLPAVGARVFKQAHRQVAQVAVDRENAILFAFRATDFGVTLDPDGEWKVFEQEEWTAAIRNTKGFCTMLALRGERTAMTAFLKTLH